MLYFQSVAEQQCGYDLLYFHVVLIVYICRPKECTINHNGSHVTINKLDAGLEIFTHYQIEEYFINHLKNVLIISYARNIIENYRNSNNKPMDGWEIYGIFTPKYLD